MRSLHLTSLWPHSFTPFTQKMSEVLLDKGLSKIKLALTCYTPGTLMLEVYQWN
jgi:hypothetical protein